MVTALSPADQQLVAAARERDAAWGGSLIDFANEGDPISSIVDRRRLLGVVDRQAARIAALEGATLDVDRLARAIAADGCEDPPLWDLFSTPSRDQWRRRAAGWAAEYARLAQDADDDAAAARWTAEKIGP